MKKDMSKYLGSRKNWADLKPLIVEQINFYEGRENPDTGRIPPSPAMANQILDAARWLIEEKYLSTSDVRNPATLEAFYILSDYLARAALYSGKTWYDLAEYAKAPLAPSPDPQRHWGVYDARSLRIMALRRATEMALHHDRTVALYGRPFTFSVRKTHGVTSPWNEPCYAVVQYLIQNKYLEHTGTGRPVALAVQPGF